MASLPRQWMGLQVLRVHSSRGRHSHEWSMNGFSWTTYVKSSCSVTMILGMGHDTVLVSCNVVTVCKAAGGAVCDRRAINFRSKAARLAPPAGK